MGKFKNVKDKVEGKAEELQGEAEQKLAGVKGGAKKLKGKAKQASADLKNYWENSDEKKKQ